MRDIFLCPNGNLLDNWKQAFPAALAVVSLRDIPESKSAVFWVHANANDSEWLENIMRNIVKKFTDSKVVVLANTPSQTDALSAIRLGAVGYCHAYSAPNTLKELKTVVTHGGVWLGNDLLQTLIGAVKGAVGPVSSTIEKVLAMLTSREKQVALEAAKGLSNKEIARILSISERTVKAHVSASLEKLGVKDRLQLALVLNGNHKATKNPFAEVKLVKSDQRLEKSVGSNHAKKKLRHVA